MSDVLDVFRRCISSADARFVHLDMVRHDGSLVAMAMDSDRRLWYAILGLDADNAKLEHDAEGWSEIQELEFPQELDRVGYSAAGAWAIPTVTDDPFRSSTARLSALAPFQLCSDGPCILLFRQSVPADHDDNLRVDGVSLVANSLLVDRFVVHGSSIARMPELRYQRSRSHQPANRRDTRGTADLEGRPFHEPTHELPFVRGLSQGRFAVTLVPTAESSRSCWHIFAYQPTVGSIDVYSIDRTEHVLFDTRGRLRYSCPRHPLDVLERDPGTCPVDGKHRLVPIADAPTDAGTCVRISATGKGYLSLPNLPLSGRDFTVEMWARAELLDEDERTFGFFGQGNEAVPGRHVGASVVRDGTGPWIASGGIHGFPAYAKADIDDAWHHWAFVYSTTDGVRIFQDGVDVGSREDGGQLESSDHQLFIGLDYPPSTRFHERSSFNGCIDEVRVWSTARTRADIQAAMHTRLLGDELDLLACLHLDEGSGRKTIDEAHPDRVATLHGGVEWVESTAPVAPHAGLRKRRIQLAGYVGMSGLSAIGFTQQERDAAGYGDEEVPLKRGQRVLLAVGIVPSSRPPEDNRLALLDFGVTRSGELAPLPAERIELDVLDKGTSPLRLPLVASNRGLTVHGAVLAFTRLDMQDQRIPGPSALEGGHGRVDVFYQGPERRYSAVLLDTQVQRASFELATIGGKEAPLVLQARSAGTLLDEATLAVQPDGQGLCRVDLRLPNEVTETWRRVPRHAATFAAVLNGTANEHLLGQVQLREGPVITLEQALGRPVAAGRRVRVGEAVGTVARAASTGTLELAFTEALTPSPGVGAVVSMLEYDYASDASTGGGCVWFAALEAHGDADVRDQAATGPKQPGHSQRLVPGTRGKALRLDGSEVIVGCTPEDARKLVRKGDLTVECWTKLEDTRKEVQTLVSQSTGKTRGYALSVGAQQAIYLPRNDSRVEANINRIRTLNNFTWLAWVRVGSEAGRAGKPNVFSTFRSQWQGGNPRPVSLVVDLEHRRWALAWPPAPTKDWLFKDLGPLDLDRWVHVAVRRLGKRVELHLDGELANVVEIDSSLRFLMTQLNAGFQGLSVAQLQMWSSDLTDQELREFRDGVPKERLERQHLLLYYVPTLLKENTVHNRASNSAVLGGHGTLMGGARLVQVPEVRFEVGQHRVRAPYVWQGLGWHHLAGTFTQAHGMRCEASDQAATCRHEESLNIVADLTIEARVRIDDVGQPHGLVAKGWYGGGHRPHKEGCPYALWVDWQGFLRFSYIDTKGQERSLKSTDRLQTKRFHHVAVVRVKLPPGTTFLLDEKGVDELERFGINPELATRLRKTDVLNHGFKGTFSLLETISMGLKPDLRPDLKRFEADIVRIAQEEPGQVQTPGWLETSLYIEGEQVQTANLATPGPRDSTRELRIGTARVDNQLAKLTGTISDVRIWNVARARTELGKPLTGQEKGLVAWWRFDEVHGKATPDAKAGLPLVAQDAAFVVLPELAQMELFVDGRHRKVESELDEQLTHGPEHFRLGARTTAGTDVVLEGQLDEVRIWSVARRSFEVRDDLFRSIGHSSPGLLASYDFDDLIDGRIADRSGRGCHLAVTPGGTAVLTPSAAPVSGEHPGLVNPLDDDAPFVDTRIFDRGAVAEYARMQIDASGERVGVLRQCHAAIVDGKIELVTGLKVADLDVEWVGQAQHAPQLVGFIEGAPPVPGENLVGRDFSGASSVEMVHSSSVRHSYRAGWAHGVTNSGDIKIGAGFSTDTSVAIHGPPVSPAGPPITVGSFKSSSKDGSAGIKGHLDTNNGWSSSEMNTEGVSRTRSTCLSLRGRSGDTGFVPDNVGLALVQSDTADVFALRLQHDDPARRALVAYQMHLDPDIPPDWNLVSFQLNPRYTSQGKLGDGATPESYFKPREAYALKARIQQQEEDLELRYKALGSRDTGLAVGLGVGASLGMVAALFPPLAPLALAAPLAGAVAGGLANTPGSPPRPWKRNLVNTYVWLDQGGFFAETMSTMDVHQQTSGGDFRLTGSLGTYSDVSGVSFGLSWDAELQAQMGGFFSWNTTRTEQVEEGHTVEVSINDSGWTQRGEDGKPKPGQVDAYRFMTFFLAPSTDHFEDFESKVVDRLWLDSSDPHAALLRDAIHRRSGCPWRILHRVTYVSRVHGKQPEQDHEKELQAIGIESNYQLIRLLEPHLRGHTHDAEDFEHTVRSTVRRHMPELKRVVESLLPFLEAYFGVVRED